jgi:hypothetical protein
MNKLRPIVGMVLSLALLAQGVAIAAAPRAVAPPATASTIDSSAAEMPCHQSDDSVPVKTCACCDADCPDMSACAFGQLAAAPATSLAFPPATQAAITYSARSAETVVPLSLLRPPISLQA